MPRQVLLLVGMQVLQRLLWEACDFEKQLALAGESTKGSQCGSWPS